MKLLDDRWASNPFTFPWNPGDRGGDVFVLDILVLYLLGERGGTGRGERGAMRPSDASLRDGRGRILGNSTERLLKRDLKSEARPAVVDGAIGLSVSLTIAKNENVSIIVCRQ